MRRTVFLAVLILSSAFGAGAQAPNTISTVAGGGTNNATASTVYLPAPYGVAKDSLGNTYLSVPFLYTVYKVTSAGVVSVYAGTGVLGFSGDGGPATSAELGQPQGLAVDSSGNLFIAESQTNRIRRVDATTHVITTVAGSGNQYNGVGFFGGYSGDGGPATSALLNGPNGVAVDPNGNLFIADTNNNVIRMVDNSPEHIITTYAGGAATVCAGATDTVGDGCPATQATLAAPEGVAIHSSGDLYIADTGFFLVRKVDNTANHIITNYAGNVANTICAAPPATDNVGDGCPATQAILSFPDGIFVDGTENVFVGDNGDQRVRRIDHATQIITSVAGNGSLCLNPTTPPPSCGDGGPATSALLNSPIGVIVDGVGNIIFADSGTDRYRMVTPGASPTISNLAGGGNGGDTLTATNGLLANPLYVVSDAAGNFFTSESFGFRVRRVDAATQAITTYAGNGIQGTAGNGGTATQANLLTPTSMALDATGNLYIRDGLVVRKVDAASKAISVVAGNGARCNVNANPTCGNGGPATSAPMARPSTIALDPQGNLYIADVRLSQIRVVCQSAACPVPNPLVGNIFNFAGTGVAGSTNGPALGATMNFPFGMVFDKNSNMFFADSNNNVIRKIDNTAAHTITTYAFNGQPTFGGDGGSALSASMQFPQAVALDPSGNLFVGGGLDNIVRRIDANDQTVITVAGSINNLDGGFTGDGGPATKALLDNFGVAVAPGQNLLIADVGNNRIRKVPLAPVAVVTSTIPASFGPVLTGGTSNPGLVIITNNGLDDLTVTGASVPAGFTLTNTCLNPATQLPNPVSPVAGSCFLSAAFAPPVGTANGTVFNGTLAFNTNDPANPSFNIALSGTAVTQPETLTITLAGTGTGTVSGSPEGLVNGAPAPILCPNPANPAAACQFSFALGEQVTLFAIGNAGSAFTGWTVNGSGTTCPATTFTCTVTMSAAQNVTANFGPATVTVSAMGNGSGTITINPGGTVCTVTNGVIAPNPCTASNFPAGTNTVTLTATAAAGGSKFAGWLGICGLTAGNPNINTSGTGPCDLPLTIAGVTALNGALATAVFSGPAKTFGQGDVFVGTVDGMIFEYTSTGTLVQVLNSGNLAGTIAGMNFDTAGNLYAANPSAINTGPNPGTVEVFSNNGQVATFDFGMFNSSPVGVLVAPSGNVFVGQSAGQNTLLQFTNVANGSQPINTFFPAYDNGGIGYIELLDDGASVLYSTQTAGSSQAGTVKNFDILNNHQNPDFATGLTGGPAFAIRELPDRSVLVANTTQIVHLDQTGKPMGAPSPYKPGGGGLFYALTVNPDGLSFWTGDAFSGKVYQVKISDGTILNTINTGLGFNSQALSFNTIFGIAVLGQPQSGGADLSVNMTASPSPVGESSTLTYAMTVTNNGPLNATSVNLTDVFPASVQSSTVSQGSCAGSGVPNGVTCSLGTINSGSNATLTFVITTPAIPGVLNNTVNVTSAVPDPIPGNNSFTTSTSVVTPSLATISLFAPGFVELGTSLTYTMMVTNPGAVSIAGISAQLSVPPVLGAPSSVSPGCSAITLICTIGTLTPGQIVTLELTFVPSGLTNLNSSATVTGGGVANATTVVISNGVPLVLEVDSANPADFITTSPSSGICPIAQGICTVYFPPGTVVTVTANGPGFVGWSVNNASSPSCPPASSTCSVTLNSPQQVLAAYSAIGFLTSQLTGVVGIPFGVDFSRGVFGGVTPYTITLTGTVPSGLTFTTPSLAGIPTATGVTQLTVNITDGIGDKASTPVTLTIIPAPSGQEALANGNYAIVFHLVNDSDGSLFAVAGSLHFNGKGVIDSGTLDTNGTGAGRAPQTLSVTGTYTIGPDHRCLITLQNVGKSFAVIACSVGDVYEGVAHTAHIIEFDDNSAGGFRGAGIAKLQDPKAFNSASFAGPYIFAGTGQDSTLGRLIEEGLFTVTSTVTSTGTFGSGSADVNDNGALASVPSITGTYSEPGLAVPIDPGTGRTQWSLNNATTSAASFIIDANNVVFVTKDPVATSGLVIAGTAERQLNTAPFDATFLSGPVVIAAQGPSNAGKNSNVLVGVGTFTAAAGPNPATGTLSLTKDTNDSGNVTLEGIENDTYTMAANGRLVVTPGSGKQVFGYLSRPNRGYVMGTDASVDFGTIDLQTGGPFTVPTLATDYFFGDREPSSTTRGEVVSGVVSLSNNTASATFDQSHAGGRLDYAQSASFGVSVAPAGRLILTHNPSNLISTSDQIGQVITPSHLIFTEFDPSQNRPTLHEEQSFLMPAGVPVATPSPVAFGIVQIGQQANLNVTITNNSDGLLSLTGVTNATDFSVTGPCLTTFPSVVLPHSSCIDTVTFKPQPGTQTGVLLNEILTIATDAGNLQINASGTAAAGAATHFAVSGPAAATGGVAFNITVTAQDAANNTATGYTGTVHFTSSDGAAALPANTTLTNGTGTFSVTLRTAGPETVTATDTVTASITGTSGLITVNAGAATHFVVAAPAAATAGTAFNFTVTAQDASNNTATGYTGTVHLTSTDAAAVLPANSTLTNGVGNFAATLKTAGPRTITATDTVTASITGTSGAITVNVGAATHFAVSAPAAATSGTAFNVTVTAQDASNNTATGYTGTVHFTSSDGAATLPANTTLTNGTGIFSATLKTIGSQTITATDTVTATITGTTSNITVSAGAATHFAVSAQSLVSAGAAFNVTVTAQDAANSTATGYTGTVHFTSNDPAAVLPADTKLTNGVGTFSATLNTVGPRTITATDTVTNTITGVSNTITVSAGAPQTVNVHLIDNGTGAVGTVVDNSVPQQINCTDATGQLPGPACSTTYPDGTTVTFTATPGAGAAFAGWNGSNVTCQAGTPANVCTVTVTGFTSLDANFTNGPGGPFTLTVAAPAGATGGGRVTSGVTGGSLNCTLTGAITSGTCISIPLKSGTISETIPVPDSNSTFGGYAGTCPNQVGNNCFVTMSQNQVVTPLFNIIPVTVNVTVTGNGTIEDLANPTKIKCSNTNGVVTGPCSANYNSGTSVTLTEFTGTGYTLTSFGTCGTATTCTLNLTAANNPVNINATFTINTYLLNVSTTGGTSGGTVTSNAVNSQGGVINCGPNNQPANGCGVFATFGTNVILTAAPQTGAAFAGWSSPGVAGFVLPCTTNPICTFNMPVTPAGGLTVTAAFNLSTGPTLVSIAVTPANPTIPSTGTQQFTATGTFSDGSMQNLTTNVTWASATLGVATISNTAPTQGLATAAGVGTSNITATSGNIVGSTLLTVVAPVIVADINVTGEGSDDKQRIDGKSAPLTVGLTNTSKTQTVHITGASADNPAYTISTDCATLGPGQSCSVFASFKTTAVCENQATNITVADDDPGGNFVFPVNGFGADARLMVNDLSNTNLITNGSFESPVVPIGGFTNFGADSNGITGWTVVGASGGVGVVSGTFAQNGISFPAQDGSQWLDLTGFNTNGVEGVEQTVATKSGTQYALSFWVGNVNNPGGIFGTTSTVKVLLGGINGTLRGTFTNSNTTTGMQTWQQFTTTFTATGPTTTIDFINADPSSDNTNGLDNVVLTVSGQSANPNLTAQQLAQSLVGPGVTISNVKYTGALRAAGNFTGDPSILGFGSGVVLSTGSVRNVVGPNCSTQISVDNGQPGDTDLTGLLGSGQSTNDAAVLEFDFVPTSPSVSFQYVFSSDEYNEFVGQFNDVFAFFLNGNNIALLPTNPPVPVSINNVNTGTNPTFFINNDMQFPTAAPVDTEMDGLTVVLTAQGQVTPNQTNHIKLAIADAIDFALDSNVFIKAGSLTSTAVTLTPPTLAFGNQPVGTPSSAQPVTLANTGTTAVNISSIVTSAGFGENDKCPKQLAPAGQAGSSCVLNINFNPTSNVAFNGTVTVTDDSPVAGSQQVVTLTGMGTGTGPTLLSITVAPTPAMIPAGTTQAFTATGHFSDESSGPVPVTWMSGNTAIATINPSTGVATGVIAGGPVTITATSTQDTTISGTAQLTVTAPALVSIAVTPADLTIVVGQQQQYTATGTFTDNSKQDITSSVAWASSNADVTSITAGGLATGLTGGQMTNITASKLQGNTNIVGTTTLTVTNVPFVLTITPPPGGNPGAPPSITPGGTLAIGLTLTATKGFNGTVTFGCTNDKPQFLTCTPAPASVTLSGNTPKQVAIVMNTFCQGETPVYGPGPGGFGGGLALLLAAVMLGSIGWAYRTRSRWALSFAVLMLVALGSAACSSLPSGPSGRTPAGNYLLTITATAGGASQTVQQPIQVLP